MNLPDDPIAAKIKEAGRVLAPFLTIWIATQLAAARYQHLHGMPSSESWRQGVLKESIKDALTIMEVV